MDHHGNRGVKPNQNQNYLQTENKRCCNIIDWLSTKNLFLLCCIGACLLLLTYLAAFSCEISWILEARGDLPIIAYILCSEFFIMFVASTILIHGLVTGLPWGLFSWSIIIGCLAIPELCLVMIMIIQFWSLQSTHGIIELVGYLIRLVINCFSLLCVIPTAVKWRRDNQVLTQIQGLASRLQLTTPPQILPLDNKIDQIGSHHSIQSQHLSSASNRHPINSQSYENQGFERYDEHQQQQQQQLQNNNMYPYYHPPHIEFDGSTFQAIDPLQYYTLAMNQKFNRAQSLLDLRYILPMSNATHMMMMNNNPRDHRRNQLLSPGGSRNDGNRPGDDDEDSISDSKQQRKNNKLTKNKNEKKKFIEHIYHTISSDKNQSKSLNRNCISLENLENLPANTNSDTSTNLQHNNNMLQNYNALFMLHGYPIGGGGGGGGSHHDSHLQKHLQQSPYFNYNSMLYNNSRQSLGNESDDYRKYRDVAL